MDRKERVICTEETRESRLSEKERAKQRLERKIFCEGENGPRYAGNF